MNRLPLKSPLKFLVPAALSLALLAACASPEARVKDNPDAFSKLNPEQQALVKKGEIGLGMPEAAVQLALGKPDRVTEHTDAAGVQKIWHYVDITSYDTGFVAAYPWAPYRRHYYDPFFATGLYAPYPVNAETDRLRVIFKDGKVTAFEREN